MTTQTNTATPRRATLTPKEKFFDALESYFDFREEPVNPAIVRNLALNAVQACGAVSRTADRVDDETHRLMIRAIIGEGFNAKEWARDGYMLSYAARELTYALAQKFGFKNEEAA